MSGVHEPYVQPMGGDTPTHRFCARCDCGCGLFEEYVTQEEAQAVVDAAAEVDP